MLPAVESSDAASVSTIRLKKHPFPLHNTEPARALPTNTVLVRDTSSEHPGLDFSAQHAGRARALQKRVPPIKPVWFDCQDACYKAKAEPACYIRCYPWPPNDPNPKWTKVEDLPEWKPVSEMPKEELEEEMQVVEKGKERVEKEMDEKEKEKVVKNLLELVNGGD